ncbi:MAG: hypothetical protein ACR2IV_05310 [Bryobacteraceae bacterium]
MRRSIAVPLIVAGEIAEALAGAPLRNSRTDSRVRRLPEVHSSMVQPGADRDQRVTAYQTLCVPLRENQDARYRRARKQLIEY